MMLRVIALVLLSLSVPASAQSRAAEKVALITDLVEALGAAGDAIAKLTDGFAHLVKTGTEGYNYVAAARARARLVDISRHTQMLIDGNTAVTESIDEYLALTTKCRPGAPKPLPIHCLPRGQLPGQPALSPMDRQWQGVLGGISERLEEVERLLADVKRENSDFVLEPAYLTLQTALRSRVTLLSRLAELPAPISDEERKALAEANKKYKALIENSRRAVRELNVYLKQQPS
jgi:hypothetical protein